MNKKVKMTEEEKAFLATQFRSEIAHRYNPIVKRIVAILFNFVARAFFIKKIYTTGLENIDTIPKDIPVIFSSVHKSHLDYIIVGLNLNSCGYKIPATIAGKNLFHGVFKRLLPALKGVCLDRQRVEPKSLRNKENLLYLSTFYSYLVDDVLLKGDKVTIFPEGGRSYSGEVIPLSLGIFAIAKRALRNHKRVAIIPIGVTYNRVTEDTRFGAFNSKKSNSAKAYRAHDKKGFYRHALLEPRSVAYISYGAPLYIEEARHLKQLEYNLRSKMGALLLVTPISLVSRSLKGVDKISLTKLLENLTQNINYIINNKINASKDVVCDAKKVFKISLNHLCNKFCGRKIIRIIKRKDGDMIEVLNKDVIDYYAKTIVHFFDF